MQLVPSETSLEPRSARTASPSIGSFTCRAHEQLQAFWQLPAEQQRQAWAETRALAEADPHRAEVVA
jgi:hypothetical protein